MTDATPVTVGGDDLPGTAPELVAAAGDPDAFTVHYRLTPADIRSAGLAASRFSVASAAFGTFVFASGAFGVLVAGDVISGLLAILGLLLLSGLGQGLLVAFMAGRRPEIMQQPTDMTVNAHGIRTVTPLASGEAAWATYKRMRPTGSTLLFELGTGAAVLVPTRAFTPDQLDRVEAWAAAAGVLDRSSPVGVYAKGIAIGALAAIAIPAATWLGFAMGILS